MTSTGRPGARPGPSGTRASPVGARGGHQLVAALGGDGLGHRALGAGLEGDPHQVELAVGPALQSRTGPDRDARAVEDGPPGHLADGGAGQHLERHQRGHGVPGEAQEGDAVDGGQGEGLGRAEGDLEPPRVGHPVEDHLHHVGLTHAHAAGGEHEVAAVGAGAEGRGHRVGGVAHPSQVDGDPAGLGHRGEQHGPVRVADLAPLQAPGRLDQLVAGGDHPDPGTRDDLDLGRADGRQHPDQGGGDDAAGPHDHGPGRRVVGCAAQVLALGRGGQHGHRLVLVSGSVGEAADLHRDDGVGPFGHGCAGHDADGLAGPHHLGGGLARHHRLDHLEHHRQVLGGAGDVAGTHREAVHGRAGEPGQVGGRGDLLGDHAAPGGRYRDAPRGQGRAPGQDRLADLAQRLHARRRYRPGRLGPGGRVVGVGGARAAPGPPEGAHARSFWATNARRKARKSGPRSSRSLASSTMTLR